MGYPNMNSLLKVASVTVIKTQTVSLVCTALPEIPMSFPRSQAALAVLRKLMGMMFALNVQITMCSKRAITVMITGEILISWVHVKEIVIIIVNVLKDWYVF